MRRDRLAPHKVREAAEQLFGRYGGSALGIARERAERLERERDFPVLDAALLVLTEVERLVGRTLPSLRLPPGARSGPANARWLPA